MSDLMRDVDEMMRQERLMNIWHRHGNTIIGSILAVILAVAIGQGYQAWFRSQAESNMRVLSAAQDDPAALAQIATGNGKDNLAVMAAMLAAQKLSTQGKGGEAAALYAQARNRSGADKDLRDLATLMWVRVASGDPAILQDKTADEVLAMLAPLMADDGLPFAWAARLESAVVTANLKQDRQGAIDLLTPMLVHPALPSSMRDRAQALADLYRTQNPAESGR